VSGSESLPPPCSAAISERDWGALAAMADQIHNAMRFSLLFPDTKHYGSLTGDPECEERFVAVVNKLKPNAKSEDLT